MPGSYQDYQNWAASGQPWNWWNPWLQYVDPAIPQYDTSRVARHELAPWGEGLDYDAAGNVISVLNPAWLQAILAARAAHPGATSGGTPPGPVPPDYGAPPPPPPPDFGLFGGPTPPPGGWPIFGEGQQNFLAPPQVPAPAGPIGGQPSGSSPIWQISRKKKRKGRGWQVLP